MPIPYFLHIAAGTLALASGYVALFAAKGASLHRRSGMLFVVSMLGMTLFGGGLAIARDNDWTIVNVSAASVSAYLVATSLTTVRSPRRGERVLLLGGLLLACAVAAVDLPRGVAALALGGSLEGIPSFPYLMFGAVAALGAAGDLVVLRRGPLQGPQRLARHLWRMTFALFIAAMSFFFGQAKVIPKPIRIMPLLALPIVLVLVALLYWMWRVHRPRTAHLRAASGGAPRHHLASAELVRGEQS